jgi:hypothetical protein
VTWPSLLQTAFTDRTLADFMVLWPGFQIILQIHAPSKRYLLNNCVHDANLDPKQGTVPCFIFPETTFFDYFGGTRPCWNHTAPFEMSNVPPRKIRVSDQAAHVLRLFCSASVVSEMRCTHWAPRNCMWHKVESQYLLMGIGG